MALILMAVIAITSALAIKSATLGDKVGNSIRSNTLAQQAAEAALRWCEAQLIYPGGAIVPLPIPAEGAQEAWRNLATWNAAPIVPADVLNSLAAGGSQFTTPPRCIAQQIQLRPPIASDPLLAVDATTTFRVTVRGFSPDYSRTLLTGTGSEVWLQSTLVIPLNKI